MRQTNLLKRAMSVALGLVLGASALLAQNITVTGTVTDAMKEPIIGASVGPDALAIFGFGKEVTFEG